jgi:hypothetical protein
MEPETPSSVLPNFIFGYIAGYFSESIVKRQRREREFTDLENRLENLDEPPIGCVSGCLSLVGNSLLSTLYGSAIATVNFQEKAITSGLAAGTGFMFGTYSKKMTTFANSFGSLSDQDTDLLEGFENRMHEALCNLDEETFQKELRRYNARVMVIARKRKSVLFAEHLLIKRHERMTHGLKYGAVKKVLNSTIPYVPLSEQNSIDSTLQVVIPHEGQLIIYQLELEPLQKTEAILLDKEVGRHEWGGSIEGVLKLTEGLRPFNTYCTTARDLPLEAKRVIAQGIYRGRLLEKYGTTVSP